MDGLIAFSKERAERAKPFVVSGDRPATEPIVLESALECSRVVADLLLTLGELAAETAEKGATLHGTIHSASIPELEKLPAKIVLVGTDFSTLADSAGLYSFRNLPSGAYRVTVIKPGSAVSSADVDLNNGQTHTQDFALPPDGMSGNLIRNGSMETLWLSPAQPDAWYPVKSRIDGRYWEGEMLPLQKGRTYHVNVSWQNGAAGRVVVRLRKSADFSQLPTELPPLLPGQPTLEFPAEGGFAQILIFTEGPASSEVKNVALSGSN